MVKTLFSAWFRNGEDIIFYDSDFNDLAYQIATGEHAFSREISNLGWHLHFSTTKHVLEVVYTYDGFGNTGSAQIKLK
jgi:hypothetical protein